MKMNTFLLANKMVSHEISENPLFYYNLVNEIELKLIRHKHYGARKLHLKINKLKDLSFMQRLALIFELNTRLQIDDYLYLAVVDIKDPRKIKFVKRSDY